jgi:hypothetical protein
MPLLANITMTITLLGVSNNDPGFSWYDYALSITNNTATPMEALHLDIPDVQPDAASLRENWRIDTLSGVDYWSAVVENDLQPTESTTLRFTARWLDGFNYSASLFDPLTYDEYQENGTLTIMRSGPLEIPEPATLACLSLGFLWLLRRRKNPIVGR